MINHLKNSLTTYLPDDNFDITMGANQLGDELIKNSKQVIEGHKTFLNTFNETLQKVVQQEFQLPPTQINSEQTYVDLRITNTSMLWRYSIPNKTTNYHYPHAQTEPEHLREKIDRIFHCFNEDFTHMWRSLWRLANVHEEILKTSELGPLAIIEKYDDGRRLDAETTLRQILTTL